MQKSRVLIIEDEKAIADTITYALSTEGLDPVWAATGNEGLEIYGNEHIDLIIIDIGLPDINGFELIKKIRKNSNIPVIFLTARSEELDKVLGLELGADDYVTKPFSPRELCARVKTNLRRQNIEISTRKTAQVNDTDAIFTIDENKKQITYYDHKLDLSFVEYKILSLLIRKPGWVYTREMFLEQVWDDSPEVFDRTVDAHIKSIRAKLKAINKQIDPIVTHRGFGYSLREDI